MCNLSSLMHPWHTLRPPGRRAPGDINVNVWAALYRICRQRPQDSFRRPFRSVRPGFLAGNPVARVPRGMTFRGARPAARAGLIDGPAGDVAPNRAASPPAPHFRASAAYYSWLWNVSRRAINCWI